MGTKRGRGKPPNDAEKPLDQYFRGTYVLGAKGELWVTDLGSDDYNLPGYFVMDVRKSDNRWKLYRKRAEGHNTLVINPGEGPDQEPSAKAPMIAFESAPEGSRAVVDLTSVYPGARQIRRELRVSPSRTRVTVHDEMSLARPADVWSFVHLERGLVVTVAPDGRAAVLSRAGKPEVTIDVRLQGGPPGLRLELAPASPLDTSPKVKQNANEGLQKLVLHAPHLQEGQWDLIYDTATSASP